MAWTLAPRRYLRPEEVAALRTWAAREIAFAKARGRRLGMRNAVMVLTALGTGLRRFELAALKVGDVRIARGQRVLLVRHGKGGRPGEVVLPDAQRTVLRDYLGFKARADEPVDAEAPLFLSSRGGHLDTSAVHRVWVAALMAAGVEKQPGVSVHAARHAHGVALYRSTKDLRLVQKQLRHADPKTTAVYADVLPEDVEAGLDAAWAATRPDATEGEDRCE